jgi:Fe-S cluster assembly protein SufD
VNAVPRTAPSAGEAALIAALEASPVRGSARARDLIAERGLPTRRDEAWRWSDLRQALTEDVALPKPNPEMAAAFRDKALYAPADDMIAELAIAFGRERVFKLAAGETHTIAEEIEGGPTFDPRFLSVEVGEGATLTRVVMQTSGGVCLSSARVRVAKGGVFRQFVFAEGAKLARIETHVTAEEDAKIELNGLYLAHDGRHADLTSTIHHRGPGAETRQLIKGAAFKGSRGVFQGKIVVDREAQQTDARQHHRGLLLEDGAEIFAKPELMIYADDVQCAHGNTAGGLDESALFYMRSRGIPAAQARSMLIEAFLLETVPEHLGEAFREALALRVRALLEPRS